MSGDPTPQDQSSSSPATAESPKAEKKPRSPVERVIVWGGIVVLLLLAGIQAHGRFGYEWSLANLQPLIDDDKEGGTPLALADVENHLVGFPSQSETEVARTRTERVYRWQGLGKSYGITLSYNPTVQPVVVTGLETDNAPPPPAPPEVDDSDEPAPDGPVADAGGEGGGDFGDNMHDAEGSGGGESGGGPGGGGPGGGGRFNPMENDADGDGKLSLEEVPERWRENFTEIDTNSDGLIDESEIEARRRSRREGGGEGVEDRPQRPSREGAGESGASDTPPPDAGTDESSTSDEPAAGESGAQAADSP